MTPTPLYTRAWPTALKFRDGARFDLGMGKPRPWGEERSRTLERKRGAPRGFARPCECCARTTSRTAWVFAEVGAVPALQASPRSGHARRSSARRRAGQLVGADADETGRVARGDRSTDPTRDRSRIGRQRAPPPGIAAAGTSARSTRPRGYRVRLDPVQPPAKAAGSDFVSPGTGDESRARRSRTRDSEAPSGLGDPETRLPRPAGSGRATNSRARVGENACRLNSSVGAPAG